MSDLPKTRNAKVMRRVIRAAYLHQDPGDLSALDDPALLADIDDLLRYTVLVGRHARRSGSSGRRLR